MKKVKLSSLNGPLGDYIEERHTGNLFTIKGLLEYGVTSPFNEQITRLHFNLPPNRQYIVSTSIPRPAGSTSNAWVITDPSKQESSTYDGVSPDSPRVISTGSNGVLVVSFRSSLHMDDILTRKHFIKVEEVLFYLPDE